MRKHTSILRTFRAKAMLAVGSAMVASTLALGIADHGKPPSKDADHLRMLEIAERYGELRSMRQNAEIRRTIEQLEREYLELSEQFGGDDPGRLGLAGRNTRIVPDEGGGLALRTAPPAPPGCSASTFTFSNSTSQTIPVVPVGTPVVSTINVSGVGTFLWDVDVLTFIEHLNGPDLDITITSPSGTVVTLTTDNGVGTNNFNGTLWDDSANPGGPVPYVINDGLATDHAYASGTPVATLVPEEALGAFFGEDPNGVWTLRISDDTSGNGGILQSWSLDITTASAAPTITTAPLQTNATPIPIDSGSPNVVVSTIVVSGLDPVITDVNLTTFITHTFCSDLDITLTSPAGTVVTITTDNAGTFDNVFNGTLWDDSANPSGPVPYTSNNGVVTDHTYANNVLASPLVPEEALAAFIGENPNGTWTLTVSDDSIGDGGSLNSWSLSFQTTDVLPTLTTTSFTNTTPAEIEGAIIITSTITVSGAGDYLWDVDLTASILHAGCADLDITITSPLGTVVTLTTDNGTTLDNLFNGTTWDDSANPSGQVPYTANNGLTTDHTYANLVTATPLAPEEALGAFIGENPNGIWTIRIHDDVPTTNGGTFNGWNLALTTLNTAPVAASAQNFANTTSQPITTATPPQVITSTVNVAGLPDVVCDVNLNLNITHTFSADLDVTLTSPAGTIVTITTDNGGANDNVFAGTTFDDSANPGGQVPFVFNAGSVTDHPYQNLVVATLLTPEEPLAAFIGENPNGTWTLTISDDTTGDGGALNSWSIDIVTCSCAATPPCPPDINGDGVVDVSDLLLVIGTWGTCAGCPPATCPGDINGDCQIDVTDLLAIIGTWGPCP